MKDHSMTRFLYAASLFLFCGCTSFPDGTRMIDTYVSEFNAHDEEVYIQDYPNSSAADYLKQNIPVFECPDKELEKTYYFRWWTYRKHIKTIPGGHIITEFLPSVGWAGKYNSIPCPAAHHIAEGRWLKDNTVIKEYIKFWCSPEANPRTYSFPIADAVLRYYSVTQDKGLVEDVYDDLKRIYADWADHRDENGLYWQGDGNDGMEVSISGGIGPDTKGYRATINSYMCADAAAISRMAGLIGRNDDRVLYKNIADTLKTLIDTKLWDSEARFYKVIPRGMDGSFSPAREEHGYVPWVYDIPDEDKTDAWLQLMDPQGFKAPFGPTTAEQRADGFKVIYTGHGCQWNGPSWPFATAQTLTGLAACLHRFGEGVITKADYFETLLTYSNSHRNTLPSGEKVCWIDENLDPFNGTWLARAMLAHPKGSEYYERGKDYNHSTFCDLVISGLVGIQPQFDGSVVIEPLVPEGVWDYFYLSGIQIAGREFTVVYDKTGKKYGAGAGFTVLVDGQQAGHADSYNSRIVIANGR